MTPDSPTCWSAAISLDEFKQQISDDYGQILILLTDMPEKKDFPILYTIKPPSPEWKNGPYEIVFFGIRDAKYLLSLAGCYVA